MYTLQPTEIQTNCEWDINWGKQLPLCGIQNSKSNGQLRSKSEIVKVNVNFTIYAIYNPPNNKPDFTSLHVTSKTVMIGDINAHSPKWGDKDTNAAGKEMEDLLNTSILELIYDDTDPPTHLHFNGAQTTPDLLLVSSNISANTKRVILDDPGLGHKPVIAKKNRHPTTENTGSIHKNFLEVQKA